MSVRTWTNPETGVSIETEVLMLPPWGTEDSLDEPEEVDETDEGEDILDLFDPSKHTVEEVLAELELVADDEAEVARILDAERAGKARKSIVAETESE